MLNKQQPTQQQQAAEYELYKRMKLLGEGAFGKAYLVEDLRTQELLVQKQMDMKAMSADEKRETQKEAKILQQLNHPNIVKFKDVYTTKKGKLCIIMEYADGGDIAKVIKDARGKYLQEKQILDWFTQICLAMKHVHDRKIIHRDLKGQNIFLTKNNIVKLGDFGIARVLSKTIEKAKTMVGTPYYLSPEIIESKPYSFKTDIWSLGVILYEMCALKPPFNADSLHFLALKIVKGQYSPIPNHYSREMKNLISILLQVDSMRRPTIHEIMKMPIVNDRVKNFLSETIRQVEFSHTILHNKKIDARVNMADIKIVNNETPCPPHLIQQIIKQEQQSNLSPQSHEQQRIPTQHSSSPQAQQNQPANYHYQNKPSQLQPSNPIQNYANQYRPPSAQNQQRPNIMQQQQDQERKKELERQKIEREKQLEIERKNYLERQKIDKEKNAMFQLQQEREVRLKRQKEKEEKEKLELERLAKERQNIQQQKAQQPQRRDDIGAGGVAVYGNPNFKPKPSVQSKNVQLNNNSKLNPPKSGGDQRNPSKPTARSGSNQPGQNVAVQKSAEQKKQEEIKQKLNEQKIQRQKSEQEKRENEQRIQREKEDELQRKKDEKDKQILESRELMKKDRQKWQRGGDPTKFEFVENKIGGSTPNSNNQLDKESDQDATTNASNEKLEQKQPRKEVKPTKKWELPKKNVKKEEDWNIEIYEQKKKPVSQTKQKSEEELEEYNSDSDKKEKPIKEQVQKSNQDLEEYNSDEDNKKDDITAQEISECIEQEESRLEQIKEETYLNNFDFKKGGDDTTFNIDIVDMDNKNILDDYLKDLESIVGEAKDNVDKMQIDEKYARNNIFDFTKTSKTQKFTPKDFGRNNPPEEDENLKVREDDNEEPDPSQQTGKFQEDFPEPPILRNKAITKDEEESINVISSGYEALEQYYMKLEEELQDKFTLAYNVMSNELKQIDYNLDKLEQKYSNNKYQDVLKFLSEEQIDKYLRLIITLVCMEQELSKNNHDG